MKLEARIGTLRIGFDNESDLLGKLLEQKTSHEQEAKQLQEQWEKAEKDFKFKMKPIRKNVAGLQIAIDKLSNKTVSKTTSNRTNDL